MDDVRRNEVEVADPVEVAMREIAKLPGLKLGDLAKLGACVVCGKRQLEGGGTPLGYVVKVRRIGFDAAALRRGAGLEMMIGGPLAAVMGPDEPLARVLCEAEVFVHEHPCAGMVHHLLQLFPEEKADAGASRGETAT